MKLINLYEKKKKEDNTKFYLFKAGLFYIFLDGDAYEISKMTTLKLTNYNNDICKCGFPVKYLDKYLNMFKYLNVNVEVIDNIYENKDELYSKVIKKIESIDIDELTPLETLNILYELKKMVSCE